MKQLIIFTFLLWASNPTLADVVATIGNATKVIKNSTSCNVKLWENSQLNACSCCVTREKSNSKKSADKVVSTCLSAEHCTIGLLSQLAPQQLAADDIVSTILWSAVDTPTVPVDTKYLSKNGKFSQESIVSFVTSLKKNMRDMNQTMAADFDKPKCLQAKDLASGGANTDQLFLIKVDDKCTSGQPSKGAFTPKYIIKGTKKGTEEIKNLRLLQGSDLKRDYDLLLKNRKKGRIAIAFDQLNLKYIFNKKQFYLSFLALAPGKSFMAMSKDLAASIKKGDSKATQYNYNLLFNSFYSLGKGLGELHRRFMDEPDGKKLLRNSIVHGDFHMENDFTDPSQGYLISIIDMESAAKSLKTKRPVALDFFLIYAFTVAHFLDKYKHPKEISPIMWNNVMLKPFLQGYNSNWLPNEQPALLKEEREIFTNPTTVLKLLPQRLIFINVVQYRNQVPDIKRVFNELP